VKEPLDQVADLLRRETGIRLERSQRTALRSALARAAPNGDALSFLRAAEDPVWGRDAVARLVDQVTIKETSFFRDRRQLDAVAWRLLLERAHAAGSGEIRVWSAACATGEEPYTLALLASEAFAPGEPPVRILGTDISTQALEGALAGCYRERAVRAVEPALRRRYFLEDDGRFVVGERIRRLVQFAPHNLAHDPIPPLGEGLFDLIICRNVLIYFDGETVERVIQGLERAMRPDGMLILGSADTLCGTIRRLEQISVEPTVVRPSAARIARKLRSPLRREAPAPAVDDALDAEAWFLKGIVALEAGDPHGATISLRRALYVDPTFGLAAFTLGRAHEATGESVAARRAYEQALRTIDLADERHDHLLEQVHLEDVATACRVRLGALRGPA
jgi:chemotaxis protein methyltransferase CheR